MQYGDEIHGELTSADASAGADLSIYRAGETSALTLTDEFVCITDIQVVSAPGGAVAVWFDNDGGDGTAPSAGETIVRGTVAANGGIVMNFDNIPRMGARGANVRAAAPAGQLDIIFTGYLKKS